MLVPNVVCSGEALLKDIELTTPSEFEVAIWWLGQNSFVLKCEGAVVYTDPYLSPNPKRLIPPPIMPSDVTNANIVTCSHDHSDHIDPDTIPHIATASPNAKFVVPKKALRRMLSLGLTVDRLVLMDDGEFVELFGVKIWAIKARHERFDEDEEGFPYLSYMFEMAGVRIYHAGDGIPYDGLVTRLKSYEPHIMLMPINGRDGERYRRNIIGNFTFQEAGDIAGDVGAKLVIPMHWGTFADNTEDPLKFVDYVSSRYSDLQVKVLAIGERLIFSSKPK